VPALSVVGPLPRSYLQIYRDRAIEDSLYSVFTESYVSAVRVSLDFLPRDAMHKCSLCPHAVSVCVSVTFADHVKTNKHIFEFFSPSGSHTILVFSCGTGWRYSDGNPLTGRGHRMQVG